MDSMDILLWYLVRLIALFGGACLFFEVASRVITWWEWKRDHREER